MTKTSVEFVGAMAQLAEVTGGVRRSRRGYKERFVMEFELVARSRLCSCGVENWIAVIPRYLRPSLVVGLVVIGKLKLVMGAGSYPDFEDVD